MGTDIHTIAQVRARDYNWDYEDPDTEYRWFTVAADLGGEDRDYDTFAVLGNVRNGCGFAGAPTGDKWEHLPLRGLPEGVSCEETCPPYSPSWCDNDELRDVKLLGDHSYNYATLIELKEIYYRMSGPRTRYGVIDADLYLEFKENRKQPEHWCGGVWGKNLITVSEEDANNGTPFTHVRVSWEVEKRDCLHLLPKIINDLDEIAEKYNKEAQDVRMVFGFDS